MSIKAGFLTTIRVNIGDEFIREGIRAVLDRTGVPYQPLYVNKHDYSSLSVSCEDETAVVFDKFWNADVFIQSGSPVYWRLHDGSVTSLTSEWHDWMWEARILDESGRVAPRFLNIGAGSCQPWGEDGSAFLADPACVRFARRAAARADLTTVRDPVAKRILDALDIPNRALACPAFLAAMRRRPATAFGGVIGVNLMPLSGHYQLDPAFDHASWVLDCFLMVSRLRRLGRLIFIAHNESERGFLSQFATAGERVFYAQGWRDYLDIYAGCSLVVANRVHGAVCAAGFGVPGIIIGNDTRALIGDYIGIPVFQGGKCNPNEVVETAASLLRCHEEETARLRSLQKETLESYVGLVSAVLPTTKRNDLKSSVPVLRFEPQLSLEPDGGLPGPAPADEFDRAVGAFASRYDMPDLRDHSETWACSWLWQSGLRALDWKQLKLVDLNSGNSPVPWFMAALGACVTLLDSDSRRVPMWKDWRDRTGFDVRWHICSSGATPVADSSADVVTAFSPQRLEAGLITRDAGRIMRPGGVLALSFPKSALCRDGLSLDWFEEWIGLGTAFEKPPGRSMGSDGALGENATVALLLQKIGAGNGRLRLPNLTGDRYGPRTRQRVEDLTSIRNALEAYRLVHGAYPKSSGGWDGLYSRWGLSAAEWIPGLAPDFLTHLPSDPALTEDPERQYLYHSDGRDFKLICHGADDCVTVRALCPGMTDPIRDGWAYGLWTAGGGSW